MWVCDTKWKNFVRQYFYKLKGEWDKHNADDLVMSLGNLNGHMDRCDEVHGGYGVD